MLKEAPSARDRNDEADTSASSAKTAKAAATFVKPREIADAARVSGMTAGAAFWRIEAPLIAPGLLTAAVLTFAHTMGEFGVVLMVGGNIPGETRTASIALYDQAQLPGGAPGGLAAALLALSFLSILAVQLLARRRAP